MSKFDTKASKYFWYVLIFFLMKMLIFFLITFYMGLPLWLSWWRICLQCGRPGFDPWVGKIPWSREWLPTPVFWPGEFHGLYSPWGRKESNTTERLSLSFSHVTWQILGTYLQSSDLIIVKGVSLSLYVWFLTASFSQNSVRVQRI